MANEADATLDISVDDNVSTAMARMRANARRSLAQMGVDAQTASKAVTKAENAIQRAAAGTIAAQGRAGAADGTRARAIQRVTAQLREQRAEVQRLSRYTPAAGAVPSATGVTRTTSGQFASAAQVASYNSAVGKTVDLERRLNAIRTQGMKTGQMKPAVPVGYDAFLRKTAAAATAAAVAADSLEKKKFWPPDALKSTQNFTNALMDASNATRYVMYDAARNLAIGGAAVAAFGVAAIVMAAKWQAAFASVERTTAGTEHQIQAIRDGIVAMSQDIPVAFSELSEIASVGSQMGIAVDGVVSYTEVVAKLTATTNLSADAAGKALGRFKAFFAEADDPTLAVTSGTFTNLASSILKVGVNSVATETGIVNVATQISSMGSYAGFTADQVIGLAGALSSVGVPPELSRGVITRLFATISTAASEGGGKLQAFADLAGVSAREFASAWQTGDFAYVFTDMIAGLGNVARNGGDAVEVLNDLGIKSVRDVPVLLRLANAAGEAGIAGGLLAQTMNDARTGWRQNIELQLQYSKIAQTVAARAQVLMQNIEALFATMGGSSLGPAKGFLDLLINLAKGLTSLAQNQAVGTLTSIGAILAVIVGGVALLAAGFIRASAAAVGFAQALKAVEVNATMANRATVFLRGALLGLGVIGGIALVTGAIMALTTASENSYNAISDTNGALAAMKADTDSGDKAFRNFAGSADAAGKGARSTFTQAENLADISINLSDKVYGASDALTSMGDSATYASLKFGEASKEFVKSQLMQNTAFTDLFKVDNQDFVDSLTGGGFNLDTLIEKIAKDGREAGAAYIEGFTGVAPNESVWDDFSKRGFQMGGALDEAQVKAAQLGGDLLNFGVQSVDSFGNVANAAFASGEAIKTAFTSATEISGQALADFEVENAETIKAISEGYSKFVDQGTLIKLAEQLTAVRDMEKGEDRTAAAKKYGEAWDEAYGTTAIGLGEYMKVFRQAAQGQQTFIANIGTLGAKLNKIDPTLGAAIVQDLASMGPKAYGIVEQLVGATDAQLQEYVDLYGQTGTDSMVALAAGQLAASQIVTNAAKSLSTKQLQQLSTDLAAGTPLADAMAKWQLDAEGNPISIPTNIRRPEVDAMRRSLQAIFNSLGLTIPVSVRVKNPTPSVSKGGTVSYQYSPYAEGGYTGNGGKYQAAGIVHAGEFVMTKEATRAIGVNNLYAQMRSAQNGRTAKSTPGYAGGGAVTGGGVTGTDPRVIGLLSVIADRIGLTVEANALTRVVTDSTKSANMTGSY